MSYTRPSLKTLRISSPTFTDDALEYQLLVGPHACRPGEIPSGARLWNMSWGLIRFFEVWDESGVFELASRRMFEEEEEDGPYDEFDYEDDDDDDDDEYLGEFIPKERPQYSYHYDSTPERTPSPSYSPYSPRAMNSFEPPFVVAKHQWPVVFGNGEPVLSRWLLSFELTATLLQEKASELASYY
ncbi:hypothetical protein CcaverHIS002_0200610 [Cutaneotrichosporon cavernicola]|uniref:Uncharacterized protein n=1 Tax=Cutaneotrichosporon cavernicola TaxID=279322 RepID=A0AA48L2F4_9TREE|nr:uncharacterized protein CcaverHIS019_0200650 [Cutaneotrichosporon cavernicola]BEI80901.1 hypothetical protein CcaverHIS002_0200610 [Cutaneotrichosporon cavernicola]BEI88703.1 hypothetical protein CcaverHIS019_0200650 [Cutaneotrichosporon cavernicola]BEI96478.1 hypothetical protein CcaverHIS631_0200670 [Cutaneotrichosporon cavernicola]BEJ04249.1 hypothetical protein CcaverHIS641_0200660 [Cutaneotrichosporon cavernicola]